MAALLSEGTQSYAEHERNLVLGDMDQNFLEVKATHDSEGSSQSLDSLNS